MWGRNSLLYLLIIMAATQMPIRTSVSGMSPLGKQSGTTAREGIMLPAMGDDRTAEHRITYEPVCGPPLGPPTWHADAIPAPDLKAAVG